MIDETPCGADSWKAQKIPRMLQLRAPQFVFRAACRIHDDDYARGGDEAARKAADVFFYHQLCGACRHRPWLSRIYFRFWAYVYYRAVRHFGRPHFNYTA